MKLTPQVTIDTLGQLTSSVAGSIANATVISKAFDMLEKVKADPKLQADFLADPQGFAEAHIGAISEVHFHTVDENNNYNPPEADAISQLMAGKTDPNQKWVRIEVRAGIGPLCALLCGVCNGGDI